MYRYRNEHHTTYGARKNFGRTDRLGRILRVKGYRFTSARKDTGYQPIQREYVLVVGEHGSARFSGLCWGYGGEGPRGLAELLKYLEAESFAESIAFKAPRGNVDGTDWELKFDGDDCIVTFHYGRKAA